MTIVISLLFLLTFDQTGAIFRRQSVCPKLFVLQQQYHTSILTIPSTPQKMTPIFLARPHTLAATFAKPIAGFFILFAVDPEIEIEIPVLGAARAFVAKSDSTAIVTAVFRRRVAPSGTRVAPTSRTLSCPGAIPTTRWRRIEGAVFGTAALRTIFRRSIAPRGGRVAAAHRTVTSPGAIRFALKPSLLMMASK